MFEWYKPTAQMQGTFADWSEQHTESFQFLLTEVGQVCILVETATDPKNPYGFEQVTAKIISTLGKLEYVEGQQYIIMQLPNIKDVKYDQR